jgi:superfamily I DNA and RNA helicase
MSDFSFDPSGRTAFQRLKAATTRFAGPEPPRDNRGERSGAQDEGVRQSQVLAGLERAVDATRQTASTLNSAREVVADVRSANQASAASQVQDVEDAAAVADDTSERIARFERQASQAQGAQLSAAAIQRLLG